MTKMSSVLLVLLVSASLVLAGCGANKEASSQQAIEKSQSLATVQQKVNYLMGQTKAFINSKEYDQAISTADYILMNLDSNSRDARALLEKAKADLAAQGTAKLNEMKKQLGSFGK